MKKNIFGIALFTSNIPSVIFGVLAYLLLIKNIKLWWLFLILALLHITSIKSTTKSDK